MEPLTFLACQASVAFSYLPGMGELVRRQAVDVRSLPRKPGPCCSPAHEVGPNLALLGGQSQPMNKFVPAAFELEAYPPRELLARRVLVGEV